MHNKVLYKAINHRRCLPIFSPTILFSFPSKKKVTVFQDGKKKQNCTRINQRLLSLSLSLLHAWLMEEHRTGWESLPGYHYCQTFQQNWIMVGEGGTVVTWWASGKCVCVSSVYEVGWGWDRNWSRLFSAANRPQSHRLSGRVRIRLRVQITVRFFQSEVAGSVMRSLYASHSLRPSFPFGQRALSC